MEEKIKHYCPECGTEMNEIYEKPALNLICPKCRYKLATTRWEDIDLDTTSYKIIVKSTVNPLISQIVD